MGTRGSFVHILVKIETVKQTLSHNLICPITSKATVSDTNIVHSWPNAC